MAEQPPHWHPDPLAERGAPGPLQTWDDVQAGLLTRFPRWYWDGAAGQLRAEAICRELLRRRGCPTPEQAAQLTQADFERAGLRGMLAQVYHDSPYLALRALFPALEPWQMARAPRDLWRGPQGYATALRALRWLQARRGIESAEAARRLTLAELRAAGLRGMLKYVFGDRLELALAALVATDERGSLRLHHTGASESTKS
jgi:hypothetical protein